MDRVSAEDMARYAKLRIPELRAETQRAKRKADRMFARLTGLDSAAYEAYRKQRDHADRLAAELRSWQKDYQS